MNEDKQILASMTNLSFKNLIVVESLLIKKKIISLEDFRNESKSIFGEVKK